MSKPDGEVMKIIRIVLLGANGGSLLILIVGLLLADMKWSLPVAVPLARRKAPDVGDVAGHDEAEHTVIQLRAISRWVADRLILPWQHLRMQAVLKLILLDGVPGKSAGRLRPQEWAL